MGFSDQKHQWVPACGGTEKEFTTRTGKRLIYMWDMVTGDHAYYCLDTDTFLTNDEAREALAL